MHRDRGALVLDQHRVEVGEPGLQALHLGAQVRMVLGPPAAQHAVGAALDPVQAGDVEAAGLQEIVDDADRAPGDDGERAAEPLAQAFQGGHEIRIDLHRVRPRRDLDEGAVEIEEQGKAHARAPARQGSRPS